MSQADSAEEKKRILALLMEGRSIIVYDNIEEPLKSDALCITLIGESFSGRVLGATRMAELRSGATFYVTGNNALLTGDMTTRAVVCVLDADCERPERRSFKFEPRVDVPKRRGELVAAVLTMTRAYLAADEPKPDVHDYRFKHYCRFVRYPLIWLGMRDPCESLKRLEDRDPVAQKLAALLEAWHAFFGSDAVTVKEAVEAASSAFLAGSSAKAAAARPCVM